MEDLRMRVLVLFALSLVGLTALVDDTQALGRRRRGNDCCNTCNTCASSCGTACGSGACASGACASSACVGGACASNVTMPPAITTAEGTVQPTQPVQQTGYV